MNGDRGLARERTVLAWNRTGLSAMALAFAAVRVATEQSGAGLVVCLGLAAALTSESVVAYGYGRRFYVAGRTTPRWVVLAMAAAGTAVAMTAAVLAVLPQ